MTGTHAVTGQPLREPIFFRLYGGSGRAGTPFETLAEAIVEADRLAATLPPDKEASVAYDGVRMYHVAGSLVPEDPFAEWAASHGGQP